MQTRLVDPALNEAAVKKGQLQRGLAWLGIYAGLLILHAPLLRLPYYWDEAGYYIFAALDFFRHGALVPHSTLANGHPPLLSIYLSGAWWLGGFHPWVTRSAMLAWQAALVWGAFQLAASLVPRSSAPVPPLQPPVPAPSSVLAPVLAALFVALAPLCFAQGSLALLDLPVAALVVWALVWRRRARPWAAIACLCAAVLMKETAVIAAGALWLVDAGAAWRRGGRWRGEIRAAGWLLPVAVLGGWFLYYHHVAGYWFGNPQYFAYNVGEAAGSLPRIALSLLRRLWQLAGYDGTWLLSLLAAIALWRRRGSSLLPPQRSLLATPPADCVAILLVYVLFHAAVGGAVLARYMLPALAVFFAWAASQIATLPRPRLWGGVLAAFFIVCWFWNPPYPFPYEDNLAYAQFVSLHQAAARQLEASPSRAPIWTSWPATDELTRPDLGYVSRPLPVHPIPDFGLDTLRAIQARPRRLYLYSQVYQPRHDWAKVAFWSRLADRYYGYDPPAPPTAWLGTLQLKENFKEARRGQWVLLASTIQAIPGGRSSESAAPAPAARAAATPGPQ